jgi:hypothetical protein
MARVRRSIINKKCGLISLSISVFVVIFVAKWFRASEGHEVELTPRVSRVHDNVAPDVLDLILNPATSKRDNFGALFRYSLKKAGKTKGNFLEIGGGAGKFFEHNMESFGDAISNYYVIEPYKLMSNDNKPLPALMERINRWSGKLAEHNSRVEIIHGFSTDVEIIHKFVDGYFDFVYIDGDHSYQGAKSDLLNFFPKVRVGGIIAGHDYCCNERESKVTVHAPWCGRYIYPHSASNPGKHGKEKSSWCDIFKGAEEFAKEHNFNWLYTLEGRYGKDNAGLDNPSYFALKYDESEYATWQGDVIRNKHEEST